MWSLYPVEGSAEMGTEAELLERAHGETSLDKGLKVKALLPSPGDSDPWSGSLMSTYCFLRSELDLESV